MSFLTPDHLVAELNLKQGSVVMDIGCGSGAYTVALARAVGNTGKVYAIDINREILHTLANTLEKNSILNVDTLWADIESEIPVDAYSADAVVLSNVLFQLEDIDKALNNIEKVLKPKGEMLVVEWKESSVGIGPHTSQVISEEEIEKILLKHKIRIVRRLSAGSYHYAFTAIVD